MKLIAAVVPGYYLVCYNLPYIKKKPKNAVVPGYYLVCYNLLKILARRIKL